MEYKKISNRVLEVTRPPVGDASTNEYTLEELEKQRANIVRQLNEYRARNKAELRYIDDLIAKCVELGIEKEEVEISQV